MSRILVIDDEQVIRDLIVEILVDGGHDAFGVATAEEALEGLADRRIGLVVSDIVMPGLSGLELLGLARTQRPSLPVLLVTGAGTHGNLREALARGAAGLVMKPFSHRELLQAVAAAIDRAERSERDLRERLLTPTLASVLANAIEARESSLSGHCERMAVLATRLGERLGLAEDELETLRMGAILHDVGKIGIPDRVLLKADPFTDEERTLMRTHALVGHQLLEPLEPLELLGAVRPAVRSHHERWDGSGYPDGMAGEQIPLAARIVAVADAVEAMSADRVYRDSLKGAEIRRELEAGRATQWDPALVDLVLEMIETGELDFSLEGLQLRDLDAPPWETKPLFSVLVVGDDPGHALLTRGAIEDAVGRVAFAHATNAANASDLCRGTTWSLVLVDQSLPDRSGFDLIDLLQRTRPGVPVLMLIGEGSDDVALEAIAHGARDFVVKSNTFRETLTERVRTLMAVA
jgi:putative two-component system response regulator